MVCKGVRHWFSWLTKLGQCYSFIECMASQHIKKKILNVFICLYVQVRLIWKDVKHGRQVYDFGFAKHWCTYNGKSWLKLIPFLGVGLMTGNVGEMDLSMHIAIAESVISFRPRSLYGSFSSSHSGDEDGTMPSGVLRWSRRRILEGGGVGSDGGRSIPGKAWFMVRVMARWWDCISCMISCPVKTLAPGNSFKRIFLICSKMQRKNDNQKQSNVCFQICCWVGEEIIASKVWQQCHNLHKDSSPSCNFQIQGFDSTIFWGKGLLLWSNED